MKNDTHAFIRDAVAIVGSDHVLVHDNSRFDAFVTPARYGRGDALAVVCPCSVEQVADLMRLADRLDLRVIPQGSHTSLTQAATPQRRQDVVFDMSRLRHRFEVDVAHKTLRVSAGYRLSEVNSALAKDGLWLPIDLSADPQIGGMLACNTGGTRLMRYGDVRHNTLGLSAVLAHPPGDVISWDLALAKNNTGLDLKQMFIGASGSFGVITEAIFRLHPLPTQRAICLIAPQSLDDVVPLCLALEREFFESLSAIEGMSRQAMAYALQHVPSLRAPFDPLPPYCLLVELSLALPRQFVNLEAALLSFLEQHYETGIQDAVVDGGESLWNIRHAISEGLRAHGSVIGFDISLRRTDLMAFRAEATEQLRDRFPNAVVADFGHLGDGGVHFNVVWPHHLPALSADERENLRHLVYDLAVYRYGASFSAEHGIGPNIQAQYNRYTEPSVRELAQRIEQALDPKRLLGLTRFGVRD